MLTYFVLFSFVIFDIISADSGIPLFRPKAKCVPTATIRGPRHACVCYVDGVYHCQALNEEKAENVTANVTTETSVSKSLPTIKYGEPCIPGQSYRMECNRCFCTSAAKLLCTQIACVKWFNKKPYKIHKKLQMAARQGNRSNTLKTIKVTTRDKANKKINHSNSEMQVKSESKSNKTKTPKKLAARENKVNKTQKHKKLTVKEDDANETDKANKKINHSDSEMQVESESKSNKTMTPKKLAARDNKVNKTQKHKKLTVREGDINETLEIKELTGIQTKTQTKKRTKARQGNNKKSEKKSNNRLLNAKTSAKPLQDLPAGECLPGRVYKSGCKRCFCDDNKKAKCAVKAEACANKDGVIKPINTPEDIRPPFVREELKKVKTLSFMSDKCDPGFSYKVSCNLCVCTERGNLLCTKELCLSFEDINRVEAAEKSGENCTQDPNPTRKGCIDCKCVNGKLSCTDVPNCFADTRLKLSSGGKNDIKLKLNPLKEKCVPQGIYRDNCNRCYCQPDGSLRCTQKTCLVYSQAEELRKQLKQLKT